MNDPRRPQPHNGPNEYSERAPDRSRAGMADVLQQALRSLQNERGGASASGLTPEALAELARRAGLSAPDQLADLTRMMGVGGGANPDEASVPQHIVFALADTECALPAETVQGVERISDIAPVPNTLPWVLGIVHLRGAILSAVDLRGFLGFPSQQITQRSRLLVVTKREMTIGLVVDGVTEMRSIDDEIRKAAPGAMLPRWAAPYALTATQVDGRLVIVLDPERILFAEKMHRYQADFA